MIFLWKKNSRQWLFPMFFWDATIGNKVKRVKKSSKWPKNLNYYFLLKHWFNHRFMMFSDVFRCFFRFQPSLPTISNVFFRCIHLNNFFMTISDGCNSRCKRSSSTNLRPVLTCIIKILTQNFWKIIMHPTLVLHNKNKIFLNMILCEVQLCLA